MKRFVVRFRVPLLMLALLASLAGNIMLGLRLYRSSSIRSDAANYHAGTLNTLWQAVLGDIAAAVDARDRDDDIKAYREHLRLVQQTLYGAGLSAEAVSQARGDGAFRNLAAVLNNYSQLAGALSVAESGISAEDTARLDTIQSDITALAAAYPADFMVAATEQQLRDRAGEVCPELEQAALARPLCQ
jgi:hypothetical protein